VFLFMLLLIVFIIAIVAWWITQGAPTSTSTTPSWRAKMSNKTWHDYISRFPQLNCTLNEFRDQWLANDPELALPVPPPQLIVVEIPPLLERPSRVNAENENAVAQCAY
jgi:hypothetical protein